MSKRLKHFHHNFTFWVISTERGSLEEQIIESAKEFVGIAHKSKLKGHTKENDIKLIEVDCMVKPMPQHMEVKISIHAHHYSNLLFDEIGFMARLNKILMLPVGSVRLPFVAVEPKKVVKTLPERNEKPKSIFVS